VSILSKGGSVNIRTANANGKYRRRESKPKEPTGSAFPTPGGKTSQATFLVELALKAGVELWHNPDKEPYATLPEAQHRETVLLLSKPFRLWLGHLFYESESSNLSAQSVRDALSILAGQAIYKGSEHRVHVRVADHEGKIYLDLGDNDWQAVEIDADGWRVVDKPPVKFRRLKSMRSLPVPTRGGKIEELRPFVNAKSEDDWRILVAWLLGAFHPTGPYAILCVHGEQGSAKSSLSKVLRALTDPNGAPLRSPPRDERDLWIAANNGRVVVLNNVSYMPDWLSDALCRLAWDGGFATRTLFENDEETIFSRRSPIVINGIENVFTKGDLTDRGFQIVLPPIDKETRRDEAEFDAAFAVARPGILGALLDAVSAGLKNLAGVNIPMPRMADFCRWVVACEPGTGFPEGSFLGAINKNIENASDLVLDASIIAAPLRRFLGKQEGKHREGGRWNGTAAQLLVELSREAGDKIAALKEWPKRPHILSGHLRRLLPNLRKIGINVDFTHTGRERQITIDGTSADNSVKSVSASETPENTGRAAIAPANARNRSVSREDQENREKESPNAPIIACKTPSVGNGFRRNQRTNARNAVLIELF
jgi:hypothetical protein